MEYKYIKTDYLDMVSGGDSALVRELVIMFAEQVEEILSQMKVHLSEKNYCELGLLAHKAKSSVAIMGMDDLAEVLKIFEQQAKEGKDPDDYEHYIARFGSDTRAAMAELDNLVNKL
jgi:HPt (histidine-containing phosphotransfer) domain-containing protein